MTEPSDSAAATIDEAAPPDRPAARVLTEELAAAADVTTPADDEPARALEPDEIRARRRPRAVLLSWAWELAGALVIAAPVHAWARRVWGAHPDGDAVLFQPGGHALLSWLGAEDASLAIVTWTGLVAFAIFRALGVIVTGAVAASLATGRGERGLPASTASALRAGAGAFFPLAGVGVVTGAVQGFFLGVGLLASSSLAEWVTPRLGDARAFTARIATFALFAAAAVVVGVVADLARVAVARDVAVEPRSEPTLRRIAVGVAAGVRAVRTAPRIARAVLAWSWRAAASLALLWIGAAASGLAGARGGAALFSLFLFHQAVMLARAGLRASWLANALRLVLREDAR